MMRIVDAQVHVWPPRDEHAPADPETQRYLAGARDISSAARGSFSDDDLLVEMQCTGVERAVLVPPVFAGDDNDYALAAAVRRPERFAVMGRIPLQRPNPQRVRSWLEQPGMVGARLTFFYPSHVRWLDDGTADWVWPALEAAGVPTAVFAPGFTTRLGDIARRHPGLRLVVDHFGLPQRARDHEIDPFVDQLLPLANLPNVCVKATALTAHATGPFPFTVLHDAIHRVVDTFGSRRVFWGSELTRQPQPYDECVRLFIEGLPFLSDCDRQLVLGDALSDWLGWTSASSPT